MPPQKVPILQILPHTLPVILSELAPRLAAKLTWRQLVNVGEEGFGAVEHLRSVGPRFADRQPENLPIHTLRSGRQ